MANKKTSGPPRISAKNPKFATLTVGNYEDKFVIHQELLTFHSLYFRAALTGSFMEASTGTIAMAEESADIVEFFVNWLYHLRFPLETDAPKLWAMWASEEEDDGQLTTQNLVELYVFADKFDVPELKMDIMTELYVHVEAEAGAALPDVDMVRYAFQNLADDAPLCEYMADAYCYFARHWMWEDFVDVDWYPPFVARFLAKYTDAKHDDYPTPCDYHHHHESSAERAACHQAIYGE